MSCAARGQCDVMSGRICNLEVLKMRSIPHVEAFQVCQIGGLYERHYRLLTHGACLATVGPPDPTCLLQQQLVGCPHAFESKNVGIRYTLRLSASALDTSTGNAAPVGP